VLGKLETQLKKAKKFCWTSASGNPLVQNKKGAPLRQANAYDDFVGYLTRFRETR